MPQLLKKVEGEIFNFTIGDIKFNNQIVGQVQDDDYINMNGFIAFLQNLSKVEDTYLLHKSMGFGLKNSFNLEIKKIEISY